MHQFILTMEKESKSDFKPGSDERSIDLNKEDAIFVEFRYQ
jgi:hypothetical protein